MRGIEARDKLEPRKLAIYRWIRSGRQFRSMIKRLVNIPPNQSFFLFGARQTGKTTLVSELFRGREGRVRLISLAEEDQCFTYLKDPSRLRRESLAPTLLTDKSVNFTELEIALLLFKPLGLADYPKNGYILLG
jgi:predicted AAA+ superfamily ATPase